MERGKEYRLMPEEAPYEPGFNMKTVWAALFVGFVMLPGAIYLGLVTGQSMAGASEWVTIILFIEIMKRAFVRLKTQEIIILYWVAGGLISIGAKLGTSAVLFGGPFAGPIWDQYFVQSPPAQGLAPYIPDWLVPPPGSEPLLERTFLHPAWVKPITVLVIVMVLLRVNSLSLGYVLFRITSDLERL
ncbi:MAG TPA: peptide transporter, partial [Candidatus Latescibacteria bacterium]|nr:peptide transporter [Candidatus Latescibacterota bacterium]